MQNEIKAGNYRHYKGGVYKVDALATHGKTGKRIVFYHSVDDVHKAGVLSLAEFLEDVEVDGKKQPRFTFIG